MIDVFQPMPMEARSEQRAAYRQFLIERDGAPDVERRTLERRERGMERYTRPPARERQLDRALFDDQYARFDRRRETPTEMLLLLGMVKVNAAEAYGVNTTFEAAKLRAMNGGDDLEMRLLLEETYHTRILLSAASLYGMKITAPYTPPLGLRALIGSIATLPEAAGRPLILAAEILGTLLFTNMLHCARKHLGYDPELRDAIEERIIEVLIDEVGHISFNRMSMGRMALAQTRMLLPVVATGVANVTPELRRLEVMPADPGSEILALGGARLPETVRRQAFFA